MIHGGQSVTGIVCSILFLFLLSCWKEDSPYGSWRIISSKPSLDSAACLCWCGYARDTSRPALSYTLFSFSLFPCSHPPLLGVRGISISGGWPFVEPYFPLGMLSSSGWATNALYWSGLRLLPSDVSSSCGYLTFRFSFTRTYVFPVELLLTMLVRSDDL